MAAPINANFIGGLNNSPYALAIGPAVAHATIAKDFNGDGFADLVWENSVSSGHVIWLLKNGIYTPGISSAINLPKAFPVA